MVVIFGRRRRAYRMAHVFALRGVCNTPAARTPFRITSFFSLFFVRLVPLGSKLRSPFAMCHASMALTEEQADQAMALAHKQQQEREQLGRRPASE